MKIKNIVNGIKSFGLSKKKEDLGEKVEFRRYQPSDLASQKKFYESYSPMLKDPIYFFQDKGPVGEEMIGFLGLLGLINHQNFTYEGASGSGKTEVAELVKSLFPDKIIQTIGDELQNAKEYWEILKSWVDGNSSSRTVTVGGKPLTFELPPNKVIFSTHASQDKKKKDLQVWRRMFELHTRIDGYSSGRILEKIAESRSSSKRNLERLSQKEIDDLGVHIANCFFLPEYQNKNVGAGYTLDKCPVEHDMFPAYVSHLLDLIDGFERYFFNSAPFGKVDGEPTLFSRTASNYFIHQSYLPHFNKSLRNLIPLMGIEDKGKIEQLEGTVSESETQRMINSFDPQQCFEEMVVEMQEKYPKYVEPWMKSQMVGDDVIGFDPKTYEDIIIASYNPGKVINIPKRIEPGHTVMDIVPVSKREYIEVPKEKSENLFRLEIGAEND